MIKWIGQHIVDLIARFRSDVYLEEVSTGTIASGGNLGLDSNNKIVKANEPTSHDAVTLAGSLDYITLSGQEITRNAIDLAQDVTGTLGVSKGGTGLTSISTLLNSNVTSVSGNAGTATALATARDIAGVSFDGTGDISLNNNAITNGAGYTTNTGDITKITISDGSSTTDIASGDATVQFLTGEGIDVAINSLSGNVKQVTYSAEDASATNKGVVELATTAEATTGTDTSRAVTAAGVAAVHATAQTGKNYRIINTSFRQDIGTTKYYLPFKSQDENVTVHREEVSEVAVCDGRVVSVTLRVENLNTHSGDANVTFGVTTNVVGASYATFTEQETEALAINNGDDHHLFHYVFDNAKHWDSTDMFAISIQSDTDISGANERFYITVVIEDDWNTYLAGSSREIDSTP